jgi:acyl-coenzyme A synthetase/AMP-(fatty) acid ligase
MRFLHSKKSSLPIYRTHQDEKVLSYSQLVKNSKSEFSVPETFAETPSVLHYTSGSTGKPKGVLHVHSSLPYQVQTMDEIFQLDPRIFTGAQPTRPG